MFGRGKSKPKPPPPPCPDCGRPTANAGRFCKHCGWDADLVGTADSHLDGVDLPEPMDDDAYADALADAGLGPGPARRGRGLVWWIAAVLLLVAFLWSTVLFWV